MNINLRVVEDPERRIHMLTLLLPIKVTKFVQTDSCHIQDDIGMEFCFLSDGSYDGLFWPIAKGTTDAEKLEFMRTVRDGRDLLVEAECKKD